MYGRNQSKSAFILGIERIKSQRGKTKLDFHDAYVEEHSKNIKVKIDTLP